MKRALLVLVVALVAACSSSSSPSPAAKPEDPGCGFAEHPHDDPVVSYIAGSSFDEDLTMFAAYADGHVVVRNASDRTVNVGADRVGRLQRDIVGTGLLDAQEGCYEASGPRNADGGGGASIVVTTADVPHRYAHVDGDAPESLDRSLAIARAFYDEVNAK